MSTPNTETAVAVAAPLVLVIEQSGMEREGALSLGSQFQAIFAKAAEWSERVDLINVTDVSQVREMQLARQTRLGLKDIRLDAEATRKRLKAGVLIQGKAIDGCYNIIESIIAPLEKKLLDMERFAELQEAKRKADVKSAREALLRPHEVNTAFYDLAGMTDEAFVEFHTNTRLGFEARKEELRLAEEKRAEQAAEAVRLKKEAEEREKAAIIEAQKREADRLAAQAIKDEEDRKERLRLQAIAEVERQKAETARQEAAKAKAELDRLAQEKADLEFAEKLKAEAARIEAKRAAAAPDKEKLLVVVQAFLDLNIPEMATNEGEMIAQDASLQRDFIVKNMRASLAKL